jgi:hypothetical protein
VGGDVCFVFRIYAKEAEEVLKQIIAEDEAAKLLYQSQTETEISFVTMDGTEHRRKKVIDYDLAEKYNKLSWCAFKVKLRLRLEGLEENGNMKMVTRKTKKEEKKKQKGQKS